MKKILALLCVSACLTAMAGAPQMNRTDVVKATRVMGHHENSAAMSSAAGMAVRPVAKSGSASFGISSSAMLGERICFLHVYGWNELSTGMVEVNAADPFYVGGWLTDVVAGDQSGYVMLQNGLLLDVAQPLKVNYNANTVTLEASEEPFGTKSSTTTITSGRMTTTIDSTLYYYIVNEDWLVNYGELADVTGEILEDGSIHIADGFAIYVETVVTTTITPKTGEPTQYTDETHSITPLYRDTWLMVPNGVHEYTRQSDGVACSNAVYMYQSNDTVYVQNLYGFGGPVCYMVLSEDGSMSYPGQPLRDIEDATAPSGDGMWYNATAGSGSVTAGNEGEVTSQAITWGTTTPWDHNSTWQGWSNNSLRWTNGKSFVIPGQYKLGDVNRDGNVSITDVTSLVDHLLSGELGEADDFNPAAADCTLDGSVGIADVAALVDLLVTAE